MQDDNTPEMPLVKRGDIIRVPLREGMTIPPGWTEVKTDDAWYAWKIHTEA